ncbi:cytochrome C oxidase subunit IV family protein [Castellaniella defragrans]|uniref:Cytochrome C oxidase subunit IV family protein n=1 Tax=Castellaniella defragrans TaxID=75697 RepID=A0A7W9TQY7_CASDE|nr:cytochrome C oxidase subunit IV family protein [Castellaniella defragrans]KAB0622732.1 cytochrome C oxidase subunit IV family protein [Castellaniella defragrans]MBB6085253.1 hypothetical protein [Castellaniella defragrans]
MKTHSMYRLDLGWLLLIGLTVSGYVLRVEATADVLVGLATLAIAYLKGRLVVLDFMELRHAPRVWRGIFEGWLLLVTAVLVAVYSA